MENPAPASLHVCEICGTKFRSPQALGGHKSAHRMRRGKGHVAPPCGSIWGSLSPSLPSDNLLQLSSRNLLKRMLFDEEADAHQPGPSTPMGADMLAAAQMLLDRQRRRSDGPMSVKVQEGRGILTCARSTPGSQLPLEPSLPRACSFPLDLSLPTLYKTTCSDWSSPRLLCAPLGVETCLSAVPKCPGAAQADAGCMGLLDAATGPLANSPVKKRRWGESLLASSGCPNSASLPRLPTTPLYLPAAHASASLSSTFSHSLPSLKDSNVREARRSWAGSSSDPNGARKKSSWEDPTPCGNGRGGGGVDLTLRLGQ